VPILRMPQDDTLGSTLGNLGQALANNLNPMNQLRGQELLQQMQQQRFDLQRQQQIDAANANAATVYQNANPHGLSDADLAATVAGIRNGTYNPTQTMDAIKAAGGYAANSAAADQLDAVHPEWTPAQRASARGDILSGRKNLSEVETDFANAGIATNKSSATISATDAARTAANSTLAPANAALAAEAAANANPADAAKIIGQSAVLNQGANFAPNTPVTDPSLTTFATQQGVAGVPQTAPAQTAGPRAVADITGKTIVAQAAPRAPANVVPAVPAVDPLTGQPVTVAPGAAPPSGVFSQPAQGPNTAATAATASAETGAQNVAKARNEDVQADIDTGKTSQNMLRNLATLRQYSYLLPNDSVIDQATATAMNAAFGDLGVTLTAGQSATNAFKAIASQMIADSRKDMGIQRLAGPEIQALATMLPNPKWDPQALGAVLNSFEGKARRAADVGALARKTLGRSSDAGVSQQDYSKYADARDAILGASMPDPRQPPSQTPQTPPVQTPQTQPALKFDPKSNGWLHLQPDGSYR
jgi:hypothetical protein